MIVFYLEYSHASGYPGRHYATVQRYDGVVKRGSPNTGRRRNDLTTGSICLLMIEKVVHKCTIFDDSFTPPKIIRYDYRIEELKAKNAKLPPLFQRTDGIFNAILNADGTQVMSGPDPDGPLATST